jgi:DNA (cytosine-5)-methyltransferase 1
MPEHLTSASEYGCWPTPNVPNGGRRVPKTATIKGGKTPTAYTEDGKKCQVAVQWWPTPDAQAMNLNADPVKHMERLERLKAKHNNGNGAGLTLGVAVKMWPTVTAQDAKNDGGPSPKVRNSLPLNTLVKMLPTPRANDAEKRGAIDLTNPRNGLPSAVGQGAGGSLNPTWVEWLMGWPLGWTDCAVSATDKFRQWYDSHTRS